MKKNLYAHSTYSVQIRNSYTLETCHVLIYQLSIKKILTNIIKSRKKNDNVDENIF